MFYTSTRGYNNNQKFTDILLEGLAPDGGLYVPKYYPNIANNLQDWTGLNYAQLCFKILSLYCDDIPEQDLKSICDKTYTDSIYKYARNNNGILPVIDLDEKYGLACVSNGPTLAFKDMAMQLIGNLFSYVLDKQNKTLNILGATSGDTGSAAEYAMRGKHNINVFMLSPHNKMSPFQQAQMFGLQDKNIFNIAIDGFFDNCQDIVKNVSNDIQFKNKYNIGTVNSINWARIVAQVVYYVWIYLRSIEIQKFELNIGDEIAVSIPSGNFGNALSAHIARCMGVPIGKIIVATNENNVLDIAINTGIYKPKSLSETCQTSSPSMDISKASNFERFVFDAYEKDHQKTKCAFSADSLNSGIYVDMHQLKQYGLISAQSSHSNRVNFIKHVHNKYGIFIDPHTADGFQAASSFNDLSMPIIVLETAQASKFEEIIYEATMQIPKRHADFINIENQVKRLQVLENDTESVKQYIINNV
jgi:threonine synthase